MIADEADDVGCLAVAGSRATPMNVAWTVRRGSGALRVAMLPERGRAPAIPAASGTSTGASAGTSTGVSAPDLARIIALLAGPAAGAGDFTRPGQVVVEYASPGGVLTRPRPAEAVVDLLRIAALPRVGVLCALGVRHDTTAFCATNGIARICIQDLVVFREVTERSAVGRRPRGI